MHNDRVCGLFRRFGTCDIAALKTVLGKSSSVLIGHNTLCIALQADTDARFVHHGEHCAHAFVFLTNQIAGRPVIVHDAGGIAVDAHFLFQPAARQIIARAQAAIFIDQKLWHDEQRHAFDVIRLARNFGQNQMHDVVDHVVLTGGDPNLLTANFVAAVLLGGGFGAHQAKVRAAVGFGQVHGAAPFARDHVGQIGLFLRIRAVRHDRRHRPVGQALVHVEGHVCRAEHLTHGGLHNIRHALATVFLGHIKAHPATLGHGFERFFEPVRGAHNAVFKGAALLIANGVQWGCDVHGQFACLFQNGAGEICIKVGVAACAKLGNAQCLVKHKRHVFGGGGVMGHNGSLPDRYFLVRCVVCVAGNNFGPPRKLLFEVFDRLGQFIALGDHCVQAVLGNLVGAL